MFNLYKTQVPPFGIRGSFVGSFALWLCVESRCCSNSGWQTTMFVRAYYDSLTEWLQTKVGCVILASWQVKDKHRGNRKYKKASKRVTRSDMVHESLCRRERVQCCCCNQQRNEKWLQMRKQSTLWPSMSFQGELYTCYFVHWGKTMDWWNKNPSSCPVIRNNQSIRIQGDFYRETNGNKVGKKGVLTIF